MATPTVRICVPARPRAAALICDLCALHDDLRNEGTCEIIERGRNADAAGLANLQVQINTMKAEWPSRVVSAVTLAKQKRRLT